MSDDTQVRTVTVEFLRPGPPHNQLLSPLTQYLAICGDAGAGVVTVPYEHAAFERKLKELRYETGDAVDRPAVLHDIGVDIGRMLGAVPGLPGSLTGDSAGQTLIHLRLTLSASELAHLPFELAKGPLGPNVTSESWLALQTRPPVCLTRNIRTVSPEGVVWPAVPRILFVSGDPDYIPFAEHRQALVDAIGDYRYPKSDDPGSADDGLREQFGSLLTILRNPTLAEVLAECRGAAYTHVHLLAHGDSYAASPDSYGLVLRGPDGEPDVVSGERFASVLTSVAAGGVDRPTVVTVASCDSGNVGTVTLPGASFAHALHESGIPLVVASQFPLSMEGSVPLAGSLYRGLLRGEHPLVLLQRLRAELFARYTSVWHDWASLVVYEALLRTLVDQRETVRYRQARRAMDAGLQRIDMAIANPARDTLDALDGAVERAAGRLPFDGQYAVECVGLRASSRKRRAQAAFMHAKRTGAKPRVDPLDLLEQAWLDYEQGVRGMLVSDGHAVQRIATLHWVLVQHLSLGAALGKDFDGERWAAAKFSADLYLDHEDAEQRAWAHGSLAELWLLRLCSEDLDAGERERFAAEALAHAGALLRAYPARAAFPVVSTLRQFQRYRDWWGDTAFGDALAQRTGAQRISWHGCGLIDTASRIIEKLSPDVVEADEAGPAGGTSPAAGPIATDGAAPSPAAGKPSRRSRKAATPRSAASFFDIEMLPAGHGDSLWIEYGNGAATHRWLIDCGTQQTARLLAKRVGELPANQRMLELFVMTHIDADHIGGALPFFGSLRQGLRFGDVWFNGWRHLSKTLGARQGEMFSTAIQDLELPWNAWRDGEAIVVDGDAMPEWTLPGGMKLTLLSPTPPQLRRLAPAWQRELKRHGLVPGARVEYGGFLAGARSASTDVDALADEPFTDDAALPNGSSIALLAEFEGAAVLLGADAHASVLVGSIRRLLEARNRPRLALDAFKLSHHGSRNNVSTELLQLLDCPRYLLSSNGNHFFHPDRQAIARVIRHGRSDRRAGPELNFNYRSKYNGVWENAALQERYAYTARYPAPGTEGLRVSLLGAR